LPSGGVDKSSEKAQAGKETARESNFKSCLLVPRQESQKKILNILTRLQKLCDNSRLS
jgi:hypothetical protein